MSNELTRFPNNVPPKEHYIWWDEKTEKWQVWFGDELPMFADGDYTPLRVKFHKFKMVEEDCDKADCGNPKCENCNEASGFGNDQEVRPIPDTYSDHCVKCRKAFTPSNVCCCDQGNVESCNKTYHQEDYCKKCCDGAYHRKDGD